MEQCPIFYFKICISFYFNFLCKHTISWSYFFIISWTILNMFQMLVLIMFKTSRFWPLVLPDDDDANTIKVAYSHTRITHITGVGVYWVIEGCSALPALGLLDRCKSEAQGQLSRCGGVIRPRLGLLHLDSRDSIRKICGKYLGVYGECGEFWVFFRIHNCLRICGRYLNIFRESMRTLRRCKETPG
jgi:hypothetical protein